MEGIFLTSEDAKVSPFWKRNNRYVPERPRPREELGSANPIKTTASSSHQDFQQSICDEWYFGDDVFRISSNIKISKKLSQTAAENIVKIHTYKRNDTTPKKRLTQFDEDESPIKKGGSEKDDFLPSKMIHLLSSEPDLHLVGFSFADEKLVKFKLLLESSSLDLSELQNFSWHGIPFQVKADTWRILAGYTPTCLELREETLKKSRSEYWSYVSQYYEAGARDDFYQRTYRQIHLDIPRMSPNINLFRQKAVQRMFERILFIWSVSHPSGYVQGINDLVTPFFMVFLHQVLPQGTDLNVVDISTLDEENRNVVEADSYWCFCKFLDGIQDNYIFPQIGIQCKINRLRELIKRIDVLLHNHLQKNGVEYLQFSFRWMNNLLTRELPLQCSVRLWDTYLAEIDNFSSFQLFVCAAFLLRWKRDLMVEEDFQGLMLFLQNPPTQNWNDSDVSLLVAEAYRLECTFADALHHYKSKHS